MRASCSDSPTGRAAILALLLSTATFTTELPAQAGANAGAQAGTTTLDPAFRLAAGGLPLAGPVIDTYASPPAAWLLSEDLSLYALTDAGALAARIDLSSGKAKPGSLLAVDPFGRILVSLGGAPGAAELDAYTRMGQSAWRARIETVGGDAASFPPAFGADGRLFALSGSGLLCLSASGLRLWSLTLPAAAACPPAVDGTGRPCVALADGSLVIASPYGEKAATVSLGSPALVLCPLARPAGEGPSEGPKLPCLAAALADGRLILLGPEGEILASYRSKAATISLAWDGALLYGLDASGLAFAITASGSALWSSPTLCQKGRLSLFAERLVAVGRGRAVSLSVKGEVYRELDIPGATGTPAISPAGLAFSSGSDWVLAAYRFEKPLGAPRSVALPPYPPLPDVVSKAILFDPAASDPDGQLTRLADIQNSLRSGTIGAGEPEAAAYCAAVATRALERGLSEAERRYGGSPLARSQACYLLGGLGSIAYREPLFQVLEEDDDPAVRASACEALAALLVDPDGRSMSAFLAAAARPVDERTALVIVAAIEGMALRSGQAPSEDGLRALIRLTTRPYGQAVRSRALAALGRISGTLR
jgi:hypothetical protein